MKLCIISNPNSPHTITWIKWLINQKHDVLLVGDTPLKSEWKSTPIINLPAYNNTRFIKYMVWEIILRRIIKDWQPEVLHSHRISSAGWLGAFSGFHPFLLTPWGSDILIHPERSIIARWLAIYCIKKADRLLCNSSHIYETLIQYGATPNRTIMIPWGVNLTIFHPGKSSQTKSELGIQSRFVVFCPRAVHPIYNQDIIIEAIPAIIARVTDIVFIFQKYNEDPQYLHTLETRIKELQLEDYVKWLPFQTSEHLAEFFRISDLVISVASSDSRPISILEAMACGVPIVASNLPALREIIKEGENGVLVPVRGASSLAEAVITLLGNSQVLEAISNNNATYVRDNANIDVQMQKIEAVYQTMVNR
jgi:L-malate glycosyltransferase